jgi:hypothetical protein
VYASSLRSVSPVVHLDGQRVELDQREVLHTGVDQLLTAAVRRGGSAEAERSALRRVSASIRTQAGVVDLEV